MNLEEKLRTAFGLFSVGDIGGVERIAGEILSGAPGQADALHLLGVVRIMNGKAGEAIELLGRALESKPDDVAILENLGLAHLVAQEIGTAEVILRRAVALGAGNGLTFMRLGMALGYLGRMAEAVEMLQTAAAKLPGEPDIQLNLGNALAQTGKVEEAVACFKKVLALHPQHVDAHFNLGTLYRQMNRPQEAVESYRRVIELAEGYAEAHNNLGLVYAELGRIEEAVGRFRRALELEPGQAQAHNNLGNALMAQGHRDEAMASYEAAIAANPEHPDAYVNLGNLCAEQGKTAEAQAYFEKALRFSPANFDAHRGIGGLQQSQGKREEAIAHFRQAFEANPNYAETCRDLGRAYRELGDLIEAATWLRKAITIDARHADSHFDLAEVLKMQGRFDEAAASYERVLELRPDIYQALSGLIYVRQHMCAWDGIEKLWERSRREAIGRPDSGVTPFSILSQPTTAEEQLACARAWAEQQAKPLAAKAASLGFDFSARRRSGKLRIGYASWDYHAHATSYLIAELFELHDRDRFEIYAYSFGPNDGSAIRERLRAAADRFIDIADQTDIAAAQTIYRDNIDILVDLKGYTHGARTAAIALRPAPVQVNWLGYPGSMGADFIDYIVADPHVIPAGAEKYYREKIIRLPDCYQINDRNRQISTPTPSRETCGLPAEGFVFCCFNVTHKILPDVFERWMRLLQAVPGSVLWLLEANPWAVSNLRKVAGAHGVAPERLIFAPVMPLKDHLARYRVADLALDTFPYTSHTTGSDALWAGCPLVTCTGTTFASRVAGSLLINAGLPELVVDNFDDYDRLALELAQSPERLRALKARLAAARETCALFDTPRFVRNLENAFDAMWDDRTNGR